MKRGRFGADVAGKHAGIGAFAFCADGDDAAAGAQIPQHAVFRQPLQRGFQQVFGFGARDEHGGGNGEGAPVKFARADEVGNRLARAAPCDKAVQLVGLGFGQRLAVARDELAGCVAYDVLQQQAGFVARDGGGLQDLGDGGHGGVGQPEKRAAGVDGF